MEKPRTCASRLAYQDERPSTIRVATRIVRWGWERGKSPFPECCRLCRHAQLLDLRSTSLVTNSLVKPFGSQSLHTATSFMTEILLIYSFSYFSPTILCWNSTKPDRYCDRVFLLSYFLVHSWYCPLRSIFATSCESTGIRSKSIPAKARSSYSWKSEPTVGNRWFSSAHCLARSLRESCRGLQFLISMPCK